MAEMIEFQEGETVLLKLRKHWIILLRDTISVAVLGILPILLFGIIVLTVPSPVDISSLLPFGSLIFALWLLAIWMTLAVIWTDYYLDLWIVTDRRIISIDQVMLFNRKVTSLALENIQEISVHTENVFETFLHYGTIDIETAGPDDDTRMEGIPNPEKIRNIILQQVSLFEKLVEANQNQEQLLHTVSHEVKNYLAKDAAALASIAEGDFGEVPVHVKSMAGSALSETRKGVKAVMGMLDSSDFAHGSMPLAMQPFDVGTCVKKIAEHFEAAAAQKGIALSVHTQPTLTVNGDEEKLSTLVFKNLIDNAFHYTPGGSITIEVKQVGPIIRFSVSDTGMGIDPETEERLFTKRGAGTHAREVNPASTGFGLFTAKQVVEAHGGSIRAESEGAGKGSTFIVELPTA